MMNGLNSTELDVIVQLNGNLTHCLGEQYNVNST
jgi:hypothetical protein